MIGSDKQRTTGELEFTEALCKRLKGRFVPYQWLVAILGGAAVVIVAAAYKVADRPLQLYQAAHAREHAAEQARANWQEQALVTTQKGVEDLKEAFRAYYFSDDPDHAKTMLVPRTLPRPPVSASDGGTSPAGAP